MKKGLSLLVSVIVLLSVLGGCAGADRTGAARVNDGRARPSSCGRLQVKDGKLCSERGEPVMLRGVSTHDLITVESFVNDDLFRELSEDYGVNVVRLAVYTYGVGVVGYCTKGDRERYQKNVANGVAFAKAHDMYAIIDWHVLSEGDPNIYLEDAKAFFAETAEQYRDHNHVLYEICNEPNGVDWQTVKRYAEEIIPIIREKDPDSVILVGNPDWSKDLESVAADPLSYDNVMYTLHFYAATHKDNIRNKLKEARTEGLPIFISEFSICDASGNGAVDYDSADEWFQLINDYNLSYAGWNLSNKNESSSLIRSDVKKTSGWTEEELSETGAWLRSTMK